MYIVALQDDNLVDPKLVHVCIICMYLKEKHCNRNIKKEQTLIFV